MREENTHTRTSHELARKCVREKVQVCMHVRVRVCVCVSVCACVRMCVAVENESLLRTCASELVKILKSQIYGHVALQL